MYILYSYTTTWGNSKYSYIFIFITSCFPAINNIWPYLYTNQMTLNLASQYMMHLSASEHIYVFYPDLQSDQDTSIAETPHRTKIWGDGSKYNAVDIMCPPGSIRVNWSAKNWRGNCPPPPPLKYCTTWKLRPHCYLNLDQRLQNEVPISNAIFENDIAFWFHFFLVQSLYII